MPGSIDVHNLMVTRGEFTLRVDELHIEPGEVFAILGTTGSGKTVLMESIAGAYPIEHGSILLDGKDVDDLPIQQRHLGILYQDYALFPHMTVRDNIAYGLKRHKVPREEIAKRVSQMLELFEIEHIAERLPGIISGGEAQRCALARALVLEPDILILDEPFSALDPTTKQAMYRMLRRIHNQFGCTIVFVTHDFHEAQTLADRVGIILNGRLQCVVPANELFDQSHSPEIRKFLGMA
ncbi:MAG: ATP-binding cassette domain-containing protein [Eggerthellaceae bacterium]|nr:ATP-binding cassette domain-containing protein [Eggerthellaceae bacterium]